MANDIPSVDTLMKQQTEQQTRMLQNQLAQAESLLDTQMQTEIDSITKQYEIKRAESERRFKSLTGDKETVAKQQKSMFDQQMAAKAAVMAHIESIKSKYAPKKMELGNAFDTEVANLNQESQQRMMAVQQIRQLAANGVISDPALAIQAEYDAIGVKIPIEQLKPPREVTTKQMQTQLVNEIRLMDEMLERFTPGKAGSFWNIIPGGKPFKDVLPTYTDPLTGEARKLNPEKEEDAVILDRMRRLHSAREQKREELQRLLVESDPQLKSSIEKAQLFKKARDKYLGRSTATASTNSGGSIEDSIRVTLGDQGDDGRVRLKAPDGTLGTVTPDEVAEYVAQGYERIR